VVNKVVIVPYKIHGIESPIEFGIIESLGNISRPSHVLRMAGEILGAIDLKVKITIQGSCYDRNRKICSCIYS